VSPADPAAILGSLLAIAALTFAARTSRRGGRCAWTHDRAAKRVAAPARYFFGAAEKTRVQQPVNLGKQRFALEYVPGNGL